MAVQRTAERVWLDGVRGFHPGEYASSVHGAQARILETLGEALTYDDLIGYGAFAFRIGVHTQLCPSAGHPCCGYPCVENSTRALPWRTRGFARLPWGPPPPDPAAFEAAACTAIRDSLERGVPVHYGGEEDGLIVGYGQDGRRWWCVHPYHQGGREAFWHDEVTGFAGGSWPWGLEVWTEPKPAAERVPAGELLLAALRQAVAMWHTERRDDYYVGTAAYGFWLQWLRDVEAGRVADPKGGMQGNGWCFDVLVHSRRHAAAWLARQAATLAGGPARDLETAAEHYARIASECMQDLTCPWDLTLGPGRAEAWTSALRQRQIARLEAAREQDQAAIDAVERALAVWPSA